MSVGGQQQFAAVDLLGCCAEAVVCVDLDGLIVRFNEAAELLFGRRAQEALGTPAARLVAAGAQSHLERLLAEVANGSPARLELTGRRADGRTLELELSGSPIPVSSRPLGALILVRDVSVRRIRERQLELTARLLNETDGIAAIGTAPDGTITVFNRGAEQMLGYRAEEVVGVHTVHMLHDLAEVERRAGELGVEPGPRAFRAALTSSPDARDWTFVRRDGSRLTVSLTLRAILDEGDRIEGFLAIARDISEVHAAELARERAEERFRVAFEHAPIGLAITGLQGEDRGRFLQANPALAKMIGRRPGELDGVLIADITHPDDLALTEAAIDDLQTRTVSLEKRYLDREGNSIWVLTRSTPVPSLDGAPPSYGVTQVLDISERRRFEEQLHFLANHDPLTGLFNRRAFEEELERAVTEATASITVGALLLLDLDGFKNVNDRFGHSVGDELVGQIARLLRQSVREHDYVARLGGDEFAIILRDCASEDAIRVAEKVLETTRSRGAVVAGRSTARVTTSIGIAMFGFDLETTAQQVTIEADIAMYDAKADGRNAYSLYHRDRERSSQLSMRDSWYARLRRALDEDRLVLHAQPIIPICGGGTHRHELLLRMRDEAGELLRPGAFLANAERFDLIGEIDRWVLGEAVRMIHRLEQAGRELCLSVNLSGKSMNDLGLIADVRRLLEATPIPPGRLMIEITETEAIVQMERAGDLARELRKLGCRVALDDFGAGFSSFYYLKHLEFDLLKIDGEFITNLVDSAVDRLVVSAVVEIARGLGKQTVAEFVPDDATAALLAELGVDFGQGFHLGSPVPAEQLLPPA